MGISASDELSTNSKGVISLLLPLMAYSKAFVSAPVGKKWWISCLVWAIMLFLTSSPQ